MAPRVWYRGEGVDVPVARPGTVHDFGDGTYFTDDVDVAKTYAKMRAPDPANQRVYQYSVEMGSMKVLDIESLPQWKEWLKKPMLPGYHMTNEQYMSQNLSTEAYGPRMESFFHDYNIKVENYDAVMGREPLRGGTQLCILAKSTNIAKQVKATRVPISATAVSSTPPGKLQYGGKIGPGLRGMKGAAGGAIAMLAIAVLGGLIRKKFDQPVIEAAMKKIAGEIDVKIRAANDAVVSILADRKKAFANITIDRTATTAIDYTTMLAGGPNTIEMPDFKLSSVIISDSDINRPEVEVKEELQVESYAYALKYRSTYSVELTMEKDEIDLFAAFKKELQWYESQITPALSAEDLMRLSRDKMALEAKLRAALH